MRGRRRMSSVDAGERPGMTSVEHAEIHELKRGVAELRSTDDTLTSASAFFAAELGRSVTK